METINKEKQESSATAEQDKKVEEFRSFFRKKGVELSREEAAEALRDESDKALVRIIARKKPDGFLCADTETGARGLRFSRPVDTSSAMRLPFVELQNAKDSAEITELDRAVFAFNPRLPAFVRVCSPLDYSPGKYEQKCGPSHRLMRVVFPPRNSQWRSLVFEQPLAQRPEDFCVFLSGEELLIPFRHLRV